MQSNQLSLGSNIIFSAQLMLKGNTYKYLISKTDAIFARAKSIHYAQGAFSAQGWLLCKRALAKTTSLGVSAVMGGFGGLSGSNELLVERSAIFVIPASNKRRLVKGLAKKSSATANVGAAFP